MKKFKSSPKLIKLLRCRFQWLLLATNLSSSCATYYRFQSQPPDATVSYLNGTKKVMIGQTPIDFSKMALPTDMAFAVLFEKTGFEAKEVSLSPSESSLTSVSVSLKPMEGPLNDVHSVRIRKVLQQVFLIQEYTAQRRFVDALATLAKLEAAEPFLVEVFVLRGSIYVLLNDLDQAKKEWERALKMDPSMDALKVRLSLLLVEGNLGAKP